MLLVQLAGAVEYDFTFAQGKDSPNDCPGYDTKQSDGEIPVMLELWKNVKYLFIAIVTRSTLDWSGSTW